MKGQNIAHKNGKRVYVGMSGGVDSSVSAALLKQQGFDVTGVFIKVWQPEWLENAGGCTWREDRLDAMRVAVHLNIPFITIDLEKEYKKEVVDYMISEYRAGRTPNPDIMCNRHVKFGGFFKWAMANGADYIATGHYAQTKDGKLIAGKDDNKDQSYFLWTLTKDELSRTIFPVGNLDKTDTRKLAKKFNLPVAEKKDSQGLCFIGKVNIQEFLSHYIKPVKGDVLDIKGQKIGHHDGAFFLTIGERRGFTITKNTPDDKPYYIIARDLNLNTITVSHKDSSGLLEIKKREYVLDRENGNRKNIFARTRHLGELLPCKVEGKKVIFDKPITIASGQSVVFYENDGTKDADNTCLGGGIVI